MIESLYACVHERVCMRMYCGVCVLLFSNCYLPSFSRSSCRLSTWSSCWVMHNQWLCMEYSTQSSPVDTWTPFSQPSNGCKLVFSIMWPFLRYLPGRCSFQQNAIRFANVNDEWTGRSTQHLLNMTDTVIQFFFSMTSSGRPAGSSPWMNDRGIGGIFHVPKIYYST